MFLKLDKAFAVPLGSVMRTSNGIKFRVTRCEKIDNYAYQITGDAIDTDGLDLNDDMRQDVEDVRSGQIVWPTVGIDVIELRGANPCGEITYIDQHIPPPIRARVPSDVSADDLLFGRRDFCSPEDESSRVLSTEEFHALVIRPGLRAIYCPPGPSGGLFRVWVWCGGLRAAGCPGPGLSAKRFMRASPG
jgi:hypothetical protein